MKKIFAIIIISLFFFEFAGIWMIYEGKRLLIYRSMVTTLRSSRKLEIIRLTRQEFNRCLTRKNEICFNGNMYDIAASESDGNDVLLYCLRDTKEEKLKVDYYKFLVNKHDRGNDKLPSSSIRFFSLTGIIPENFLQGCNIVSDMDFKEFNAQFPSVILSPESPPPKA